jgi:integrase/recombinase XerC
MTRYHLTHQVAQARPDTVLYHLTHQDNLSGQMEAFLLAGRVDKLAPATLAYYRNGITKLVDYLCAIEITDAAKVTASDIRMFLLFLQDRGNGPQSLHDYYRAIRRFFNWLIAEDLLVVSPMAKLKPPKVPVHTIRPFTKEEIMRLLVMCDIGRFVDFRNKAMVLIFLDTGLRLRELAEIMLQHIDLKHETIKVMGKGAKERVVRISTPTQKALLDYLRMRKDDYSCLWVNEYYQPLTRDGIAQAITGLGKRAGLTEVRCSPHTFRHTFATMALRCGAGELEVQSLLGHATLTMTRQYTATLKSEYAVEGHKRWSPVDNLKLR